VKVKEGEKVLALIPAGVMVAATVVIQITAAEVAMTILLMTTRAKTSWKAILDQNNKKIMG
jgi:hypothetical protein